MELIHDGILMAEGIKECTRFGGSLHRPEQAKLAQYVVNCKRADSIRTPPGQCWLKGLFKIND